MVSKKNLMEIVKKLMTHMSKAEGTTYRLESNSAFSSRSSFYSQGRVAEQDYPDLQSE